MSTRLGLALGTTLTAATAVWWLGASRIAMQGTGDTALLAAQALFVLDLLRAMLIAVSAPRIAAVGGYRAGVNSSIPIVTSAWPLVVLAWMASAEDVSRTLVIELGLLGGALAVPALGSVLTRWRPRNASIVPWASLVGVVLACSAWQLALHWRPLAQWIHA